MRDSVLSGVVCAFGVVLIYLTNLLYSLLPFVPQIRFSGVSWLLLAAGLFTLGFAGCELIRRESAKRQDALETIGFSRLTSEEGQRLCDQISRLFPTDVNVDPLAKYVISERTQLYLADISEIVSQGGDLTTYCGSTVFLLEDHRFTLPAFELSPISNPLRVLGRLLRLTLSAGNCRKFESLYDVTPTTDEPASRTLSLAVRQWLSNFRIGPVILRGP